MLLSKQLNIGGAISAAVLGIVACIPKCNAQDAQQSDPDTSFLSRVTVEVPVYTRHIPNDAGFNDHNWGAFINVDLAKSSALGNAELSVAGGTFINSYRKNTAFLAGEIMWSPIVTNHLKIEIGPMLGFDLNGGYKGYSDVDPLLGAIQVRVSGTDFAPENELLNRLGTAITIMPGQETAINLALTVRL
jgi:hypothetical protein